MAWRLIRGDAITLQPVPKRYARSVEGFLEYLSHLRDELRESPRYLQESSCPVVMHVLEDAAKVGILRRDDCVALMDSNIQFLRLCELLLTKRIEGQVVRTGSWDPANGVFGPSRHDAINADKLPYLRLSRLLDFILFAIETISPHINLLFAERTPYEMRPMMTHKLTAVQRAPIQKISLQRWRRYIREDTSFPNYDSRLAREYRKYGYWIYMAPCDAAPKGLFLISKSGDMSRMERNESGEADTLKDVCQRFRLEMIGTYARKMWMGKALHFLPERLHLERSPTNVRITIPDFYSFNMIREAVTEDFWLLSLALEGGKKAPRPRALLPPEEMRRLGVAIRRALKRDRDKEYADSAICCIWKAFGGLKPGPIFGDYPPRRILPLTLAEVVDAVSDSLGKRASSRSVLRTWHDVLFVLTQEGKWSPPAAN